MLDVDDVNRLREYMFPEGHLNTDVVGKDAVWIADKIGLRLTAKTRLLVAPFDVVRSEEVLAHEKLSPVIGMVQIETWPGNSSVNAAGLGPIAKAMPLIWPVPWVNASIRSLPLLTAD